MNTAHGYLFDDSTPLLKRTLLLSAERMTAPVTDWLLTMNRQDEQIARRYRLGRHIVPTPGMGIALTRFSPPSSEENAPCAVRWNCPKTHSCSSTRRSFPAARTRKCSSAPMPERRTPYSFCPAAAHCSMIAAHSRSKRALPTAFASPDLRPTSSSTTVLLTSACPPAAAKDFPLM